MSPQNGLLDRTDAEHARAQEAKGQCGGKIAARLQVLLKEKGA